MRATVMYGAGDVRIENVPDARLIEPTDAVVRISHAAICGSDLWPYTLMEPSETGRRMGHEAIGVVEARGADVRTLKVGDVVLMPFAYSDGTCVFCHEGLHTSCIHGGFFGSVEVAGAQAEAVRIPLADGTLFVLPGRHDALLPSLLTLTDVMGTGHHAVVAAKVGPGKTVAVIGIARPGGAVGRVGVPHYETIFFIGDDLSVRSWRGRTSAWFRGTQARHEGHIRAGGVEKDVALEETDPGINDQIDAMYHAKYRRYGARYVDPMVTAEARAATIKLVPRSTTA